MWGKAWNILYLLCHENHGLLTLSFRIPRALVWGAYSLWHTNWDPQKLPGQQSSCGPHEVAWRARWDFWPDCHLDPSPALTPYIYISNVGFWLMELYVVVVMGSSCWTLPDVSRSSLGCVQSWWVWGAPGSKKGVEKFEVRYCHWKVLMGPCFSHLLV